MGFLSLLPAEYVSLETWLKRLFLLLACIMIGPWALLIVYDFLLYIARSVTYEIPVVGGRARGKARPRAPSLTERPSGHRRKFSLARRRDLSIPILKSGATGSNSHTDSADARWRGIQEETDGEANKDSSAGE